MDEASPHAVESEVTSFESRIGCRLPEDYRQFLVATNGGYLAGKIRFSNGSDRDEDCQPEIDLISGVRQDESFSLDWARECYQLSILRIPREMLWIMRDPFGNGILIGLEGEYRGKMYFWDHECEPNPSKWDGKPSKAANITFLTNSFTEFVDKLVPNDARY